MTPLHELAVIIKTAGAGERTTPTAADVALPARAVTLCLLDAGKLLGRVTTHFDVWMYFESGWDYLIYSSDKATCVQMCRCATGPHEIPHERAVTTTIPYVSTPHVQAVTTTTTDVEVITTDLALLTNCQVTKKHTKLSTTIFMSHMHQH